MSAAPPPADVSVLIPAAGSGERLGMGPKAMLPLAGRPLIDWVVDKARQVGAEVLVACAPGMTAPAGAVTVGGGATRQDSVLALVARATRPWCLLWDAASPFASVALARQVLAAAAGSGAATSCLPASVSWFELEDGFVARAHPAGGTASSQTPQAYATALLREVTAQAVREGWHTQSTVQLLLQAGHAVAAVPGERLSIKLTTPEDWILSQALHALLQR
ncbi:MAG: hypothetical protein JWQ76_2132 [Ramlibacter sp.]|nr:hypothetical protein [Ramlibacter sp.]